MSGKEIMRQPMRNVGDRPIENKNIYQMTLNELEQENERLEDLSDNGELTVKEGRRLVKIRRLLAELDQL